MKRHIFAASLALAVLAVLGLVGPVAAGEQVPFKGSMQGMRVSITSLAPPFALSKVAITGNATHLGKYKLVITGIVNLTKATATGSFVFVAANGDTLTAQFTGISMPTATPGVNLIVETAIITGGTGRFAGASGSFTSTRLFNTVNLLTTGSFTGTISSPGASK
jgi:hypothetical protein